MSTQPDRLSADAPGAYVDPRLLGKGLAGLRIFVGIILFANGLAKLFSFRNIEIGPYRSFLINRQETRSILQGEASRSELGVVKTIVNDVLLPNFDWLQWVVTFVELGVGALLIIGLASRGAALVGPRPAALAAVALPVQRALDVRAAPRVGATAHSPARAGRSRLGPGSPLRPARDPATPRVPVLTTAAPRRHVSAATPRSTGTAPPSAPRGCAG